MGNLVGGGIGAAAGALLGGPVGAGIGSLLGSATGMVAEVANDGAFCKTKHGELKMSAATMEAFQNELERIEIVADGSRDVDISEIVKTQLPGCYKAAIVPFSRNGTKQHYVRLESYTELVVVIICDADGNHKFRTCFSQQDELDAVMGNKRRAMTDIEHRREVRAKLSLGKIPELSGVRDSYSRPCGLTVLTKSEEENFTRCYVKKCDLLMPVVSGVATVAKAVLAPYTTFKNGNGWIEHWFIVLTTPSQKKLVVHKDFDGNIVVNKCISWEEAYKKGGYDKKGTNFYKATVKSCLGSRSMGEVTKWLETQPCTYRLTDDNCQAFANKLYCWF